MAVNVLKKVGRLPAEYQEVEYIESTGEQYIDLGIKPTNTMTLELKFQADGTTNGKIFGSRVSAYDSAFAIYLDSTNHVTLNFGNVIGQTQQESYSETINTITSSISGVSMSISIANESYSDTYQTSTSRANNLSLLLFAYRNGATILSAGEKKIWYLRLFDGGDMIINLVPCYRKSDNVVGMYDLVNGVFYTNQGSGEFLKGEDVVSYTTERVKMNVLVGGSRLPSDYQEVEYIESSGTQYIDTGVKLSSEDTIKCKFEVTATPGSYGEGIFGTMEQINSTNTFFVLLMRSPNLARVGTSANQVNSTNVALNTVYNVELSNGKYIENGTTYTFTAHSGFNFTTNCYVFARNQTSQRPISAKIYSFEIANKFYGIPCYRKSDNSIGLYDTVSQTFFTNAGTGTFIKGSDVNSRVAQPVKAIVLKKLLPSEYEQVGYIESSGTQWIDIPFDNTSTNINKYEFKYMHRDAVLKSSTILGNNNDYNRIGQLWFRTDGTTRMSIGDVISISSVFNVNTILGRQIEVTIEVDNANKKYSVVYDGNEYDNIHFTGSSQTPNGLKILTSGTGDSQAVNIVLYAISIYGDNNLLFKGIPCYRKSDNEVGLYDLVNGVFYTNAGTGTFLKGADTTQYEIIKI